MGGTLYREVMIMQSVVTGPRSEKETAGGGPAVSRKCLALGSTALSSSCWGVAPPPGARHRGRTLALILPQLGG